MKLDNHQTVIIGSVEKMVNKVLSLDDETLDALATLEGNVIEIDVLNTDIRLFILPSAKGVTLVSEYEDKIGVSIKGTPSVLLKMITTERINAGDVEIIGNVKLAHKLQSIFKEMDIDWEEYLAQFIGDITAHKVGNLLRGMIQFAKASSKTIGLDISEYFRYEKETLLDQSELNEFNYAVDQIRNDVERLKKRVDRLSRKDNE